MLRNENSAGNVDGQGLRLAVAAHLDLDARGLGQRRDGRGHARGIGHRHAVDGGDDVLGLQAELGEIEQSMGDPELYTEGQKPRLTALLARQGPLKGELEEVEMEWMTLSEELETQEQAFANEP